MRKLRRGELELEARVLVDAPGPQRLLDHLDASDRPFLLLSGAGDSDLSGWSYGALEASDEQPDLTAAFDALGAQLGSGEAERSDDEPPFTGGAVGYLGYDLGWNWSLRPRPPRADPLEMPASRFHIYDAIYAFDSRRREGWLIHRPTPSARARARRLEAALSSTGRTPAGGTRVSPTPRISRRIYEDRVRAALEEIAAGEVYQINLTHPLQGTFEGHPGAALKRLLATAPPFAAYLGVGEQQHVVSASPECFLDIDARGRTRSYPIKGTRRRGRGARDAAESLALTRDPKERAEHLMIVDLLRNDLGRICRPGSVSVDGLAYVESFPTVHHLTSRIEGWLESDTSVDAMLAATFPGGSITGAPKLRAMEIIDRLEGEARGIYTGAIFWVDGSGATRSSIAIRTAQISGTEVRIGVGGGIVADSDPAREWAETELKARALCGALAVP